MAGTVRGFVREWFIPLRETELNWTVFQVSTVCSSIASSLLSKSTPFQTFSLAALSFCTGQAAFCCKAVFPVPTFRVATLAFSVFEGALLYWAGATLIQTPVTLLSALLIHIVPHSIIGLARSSPHH